MDSDLYNEGDFISINDSQKAKLVISMIADIEEGIIVRVKQKRGEMLICEKEEPIEPVQVKPFPPNFRFDVHTKIHNLIIGPIEDDLKLRSLAAEIYDEYHDSMETSEIRNLKKDFLAKASIYLASQKLNLPISLRDFEEREMIVSYSRRIKKEINLQTLPTPPEKFVKRYGNDLSLDNERREKAIKYAEGYVSSRSPVTVAAAAIYLVGQINGDQISQIRLKEVIGVTPVSVRKCYEDMKEQFSL